MSVLISQAGLNFVRDLLITKAVSSLTPLHLPPIVKNVKIPVAGEVHVVLSNITVYKIDVLSSYVKPGDTGVTIVAAGTTCHLSMNWHYSYSSAWLVSVKISDSGRASVQIGLAVEQLANPPLEKVEGMEIGLTLGLENKEGALNLSLLECGCHVKDISIKLAGGASWLYQGFSLPPQELATLNLSTYPSKMLGISLDEAVFNSASAFYFDAEFMQWIVNKVPEQSLLNTAGWRFIIPQLYKKYPNADMDLNISLSAPPVIRISEQTIVVILYADLVIDVLDDDDAIPVVCISLIIRASGSVKITGNNLAGSVKLNDFSMLLKWSKIGSLRMYLIQDKCTVGLHGEMAHKADLPVIWTMIEKVFLPYANSRLGKAFPLPIIRGFTLQNAEIICSNSRITVCSDVTFVESYNLVQPLVSLHPWT
ncbi:hypothetical protein RJ639_014681 [Escallonia herrerae]|uniref:Lipid-binding serum glycoprotein C-terminal domain-containing protein n=1 Tax=Escallonia herrerae TaxID=1293975 RepID=A0AA88VPN6_9ASTE|nr:hypothetical protein RJ639_014681 [Escallonia herrerae]